ncbi:endonuclease/exonuclease/phosphatase family protein [Plantactinospora soyae]|uniref:Endonuclease/exonuclease/phosphatase (EEP) superfamily protein YafD n=1 Tax=Plantactinospora soyae TaxID=1544732 RepID=A0A927MDF4_9ACTN|nr:endonuclease/exonuclease/phosphatase family protein [Plantactinospora soyae]MBE1491727.1 endonuclease/exonuclease/phosphatase (EEP) superfamily protein YafD [Plantactinospora soyae]
MKTLTRLLGALLLVVATPAMAAVAAEPKNLQVMSWNMCGSQRSTWGCAGTGTPQQKIDVVMYHVQHNFVHAALLQEVCENDLTLLMGQLGVGWSRSFFPYQWSQDGVRSNSRCGNDNGRSDRIGTAIVIKAGMSSAQLYPTTQPWTGQNRPFQCATATYWNVRLCNVHLSTQASNPDHPDWEYGDDQLAEIRSITSAFPRVVFGGDFNVTPPDSPGNARAWLWPAGLYSTGAGTAGYQECDQEGATRTGRPTHDGGWKIDYVFSSEPRRWCALGNSAYSDHHVLVESVSVA